MKATFSLQIRSTAGAKRNAYATREIELQTVLPVGTEIEDDAFNGPKKVVSVTFNTGARSLTPRLEDQTTDNFDLALKHYRECDWAACEH